ncbi:DBH-like monooxygenase protein 2 homolog [Cloeon dipterum]|uniref:DBH-like monooxygenase protein 2 homolog n=1 Tax=Cloeon dipterum TaxID=197152 RepID=UPI0032200501
MEGLMSAAVAFILLHAHFSVAERIWSKHEILDHDSQFTLSWNPKLDAEGYFHFSLRAVTKGYLGFGLSDTGTMAGSDLVVAWPEKNGNITVMDMYASQNGLPRQDAHNDWHLKGSSFNRKTGIFQVTLARRLAAYDDNDLPINEGPVQIIYAWGKARALEHHGTKQRGARKINLLRDSNGSAAASSALFLMSVPVLLSFMKR